MPNDRWLRVKDVLAAALEETPDRRAAFLDEACADDPVLRAEADSLLRAHTAADTFLEKPLIPGLDPDADGVPESEPHVGRILGHYLIEECIGRGGMGTVYLARRADQEFERRVAIKMIRRGMDSEAVIRRFRHERQILASLDHPHIAALFDGGTTPEGLPYFVMEYVAGTPIDRYADEHRLSVTQRLELCLPVLDAVQHAHDRHIVHRDIKPGNVMVTADGHPKLLDFGIAKILDPGTQNAATVTSLGRPMTPDYASPEQIRGEPVTAASDVYALGLLLYELVTGHRPYRFATHTPEEMARAVCEQDPERPSARSPELLENRSSGALDDVLLKAIRKEPDQRYSSVAALAGDLRRCISKQPISLSWEARRYRARRFVHRHRTAMAVSMLLAFAIGITALLTTTATSRQSSPAASEAPSGPLQIAPRPSVAVVEFRNLSARPADQWLSTAMAEMLTSDLGGDGQLRVLPGDHVARTHRGLAGNASLSVDGIDRLRSALASDYLLVGNFAITDGPAPRALRIDVRVHRGSGDSVSVSGTGDEGQLFTLIADVGRKLRAQLGLRESPMEATRSARAAFPQTLETTRLYAEGMTRLRLLDAVAARDLLESAAAREPGNPMVQTALASAWTALGYDTRAAAAAQAAFNSSVGLTREDRLNVEGRLYETQRKWPNAVDIYRTLWGFFSDNIEYGLRLASAQTAGGQSQEALKTIQAMRQLPAPQNDDPRIDLAESQAASALGDFSREFAAIQQAVQRAERAGARPLIARARLIEGRSHFNRGRLAEAEKSLSIARQIFEDLGDRGGAASALNSLANVIADQHNIQSAERLFNQALAMSEEIGDQRGTSAVLNNLGILLKDQRRFDEARRLHERALAIRREIGDQNWTAISLSNIGVVLFEQDRLRDAAMYYRESLGICRAIADRRGEVRALHNLAIVEREMGNLAAARAGYEESLLTREAIGDRRGSVSGRVELGIVLLAQGELGPAQRTQEETLKLAREVGLKTGEAQALFQLGQIALASGDLAGARRLHEGALAIRRDLREMRTIPESQIALANLALEEGRVDEAERAARSLLDELRSEPASPLRIEIATLIARARLAKGDHDGANRALEPARRLSGKTERIETRRSMVMAEAELDAALGHIDRARERLNGLRALLGRSGMALADLESRVALLRLDRAEGLSTVQAGKIAVEKDAKARRAGLILRRVQAL